MRPLVGEREREVADRAARVAAERGVGERPKLLGDGQARTDALLGGRTFVRARRVVLPIPIHGGDGAQARRDARDDAGVERPFAKPRAELRAPIGVEARHDGRQAPRIRDESARLEQSEITVTDAGDQADAVAEGRLDLRATAPLAIGAREARKAPRTHAQRVAVRVEARLDRCREQHAPERIGAEMRGRAPAQHLDALERALVDGEEVLIGPLSIDAVVETDSVEDEQHLLTGQPAHIGARLAVRRLLHADARLVAQRVGGRARDALFALPPRDDGDAAPTQRRARRARSGAGPRGKRRRHGTFWGPRSAGRGGLLGGDGRGERACECHADEVREHPCGLPERRPCGRCVHARNAPRRRGRDSHARERRAGDARPHGPRDRPKKRACSAFARCRLGGSFAVRHGAEGTRLAADVADRIPTTVRKIRFSHSTSRQTCHSRHQHGLGCNRAVTRFRGLCARPGAIEEG